MLRSLKKRYTARGLKAALSAGVAMGVFGNAALAQITDPNPPLKLQSEYFGFAVSTAARVTYTDNINLSRDGLEDDEIILSTGLSGGAIFSTPRFTALVLGDLDFSYLTNEGDFRVNQNIGATSTFTGVENWLYVDLSGQTSRQLLGDNARFSANQNAARGQRADVHSFSASPYLYHQLPDQSSVELRYRFSQVFVDDDSSAANFSNGNFLNDSQTHEVVAIYDSGALFDRLRFRTTAFGSDTVEDGSDTLPTFEYRQGSAFTEIQVALSDQFSLSGAVGYDEIDTDGAAAAFFDDDRLSGVFWRAGFTATPGRRTRVRLEYGRRFDDDFIDADVAYELSSRFLFTAGASRIFQTRAQAVSNQFRSVQRRTLDFADALREGEEASPRAVIEAANRVNQGLQGFSAQTTGVGVSDQAFAALTAKLGRTDVTINGNYSDDDFGFRQIETYGAGIAISRRLSRRLTAAADLNWRHANTGFNTAACEANPVLFGFDPSDPLFMPVADCADLAAFNGASDTILGRLIGQYRLYENVTLFGEITHTERFSPNALLEYDENTAMVGLSLDF